MSRDLLSANASYPMVAIHADAGYWVILLYDENLKAQEKWLSETLKLLHNNLAF